MHSPPPQRRLRSRSPRRLLPVTLFLAASSFVAPLHARLHAQDGDESSMRLPGGQVLRGTVTAVHGDSLTLKSVDGELFQVTSTDNTRVVRSRQSGRFADIKVGEGVGAGGILDAPAKTLHAAFVAVIDADEVRRAQADFGKTYIAGRIAAIDPDALKLTIERLDNVRQVIAVDESTSFRRGGRSEGGAFGTAPGASTPASPHAPTGESITLADLKVGDSIAGRGSLKSGTFVPAELHVFGRDRAARNGGRRAPGTGATGATGGSHP